MKRDLLMQKNFLGLSESFANLLKGKSVVVTGGASGLGKATALGLAFTGATVGVLDINEKAARSTVEMINLEYPNKAVLMVADVTSEEKLEKAYAEFASLVGGIDYLVNCAGVARLGPINELKEKDIRFSNDVNLLGYFLNAAIATRYMVKKQSGGIVNISSASARSASENSSLYGVSKDAQCMMTRSWAIDLGKYNIRVNTILAGDLYGDEKLGIVSEIWNQKYFENKAVDKGLIKPNDSRLGGKELDPEIRKKVIDYYSKRTALGKQITYADVVGKVIWLCSDLSSKITGESIAMTGGNPGAFSK
jgi:NAD(P)-dependent dehydrogenase (short-subunit alcohol dehydrogenase family)